jgi:hypothetical protein
MPGKQLELLALEDPESIQLALSMVINALATSSLDTKRATALLYGLQLASLNAARLCPKPSASDIVREIETSPDGLDFTRPEVALPEVAEDSSEPETEEHEAHNAEKVHD